MLLPFVEKGNHAQRFLRALAKLDRAKGTMLSGARDEGWVIYLADERSFQAGKPKPDGAPPERGAGGTSFSPFGTAAAGSGAAAAAAEPDPFPNRMMVTDLEPVHSMVAAVYATNDTKEPYRLVKRLVAALNPPPAGDKTDEEDASLFSGVDLMPESESAGREDVFVPWVEYFKRHDSVGYRRFVLRLPFLSLDIQKPSEGAAR